MGDEEVRRASLLGEAEDPEIRKMKELVKEMLIWLYSLEQKSGERRLTSVGMQESADELTVNFHQLMKTKKAFQMRLEALETKWQKAQPSSVALQTKTKREVLLKRAAQEEINKGAETEGQERNILTKSNSACQRAIQKSISLEGAHQEAGQEKQKQLASTSTSIHLQRTSLARMLLGTAEKKLQEWQASNQRTSALQQQNLGIGEGKLAVEGWDLVADEKGREEVHIIASSKSDHQESVLETEVLGDPRFEAVKTKWPENGSVDPSTSVTHETPQDETLSQASSDDMEGLPARLKSAMISVRNFSSLQNVSLDRTQSVSTEYLEDTASSQSPSVPESSASDGALVEEEQDAAAEIPSAKQQRDMGGVVCKPAGAGRMTAVQHLVQHLTDLSNRCTDGTTPLHVAALLGQVEATCALVTSGASLEAKDLVGWTPLHTAAWRGGEVVVRKLLQAGADSDVTDFFNLTPLHYAVRKGHRATINVLLEAKGLAAEEVAAYANPFEKF